MDNTFERILTRSRRRQSVESSDMREDDNLSNVGTPTKKTRVTKRLSSKLEDVQEGNSSPPKMIHTENETKTPVKSLKGRRSLSLTVTASPKPDVANSPIRNLRRSQRHSPIGSEKSPSDNVNVPAGVKDDVESVTEKKNLSPSKSILMKKDILSAHNTFDSPKPKKNQKGKIESSNTPNPRRSRRLSTELNIVQEDPIKEEEVDAISLKGVTKPRRGKRLSIAPAQPSLPEEIEEQEIVNTGSEPYESLLKDISFKTANCSVQVTDLRSPNKSLSNNSFNESKVQLEINKTLKEGSKSPKMITDKSVHLETEKPITLDKSLKLNNSHILIDNIESRNKSMSALEIVKSKDTLNASSTSLKEYSLRNRSDNSANLNMSDVICKADKDSTVEKLNSSKSSNKSLLEMNTSTANQSKRSNRKSSSFVDNDNSRSRSTDNNTSIMNNSTHANNTSMKNLSRKSNRQSNANNTSMKNLSRKSNRQSNANETQDILDLKEVTKISDDLITYKDISLENSSRKSSGNTTALGSSQPISPENKRNSVGPNISLSADGECSPANSSKHNRKSAKDFFVQDTPNENSPDSKSFMSTSKNRGKNLGDVATSTPNIFGKEVVSKTHLMKATSINLSKKNESLNSSCHENVVSKTRKNNSTLVEDLHMSVTEYMPTPAKISDKSGSKIEKEELSESDESESIKLTFLDSASEAGSNYQSGDSMNDSEREEIEDNEIVEKGETLGTEPTESENASSENDSFVCSDDSVENLLSGTGDDLSSGDDKLTQSKASKMKYNLKQIKKQKDSSKEMFESRHSKSDKSKVNSSSHSNKKYMKIMNVSSDSEEEPEYMDVDNSILPDSHSKTDIKTSIIKLNSSVNSGKDNIESPYKKHMSMNESQKNETLDPLSTSITGNNNKSFPSRQKKDDSTVTKSCDGDVHDSESLSSLSEGEEIKNITSIYEKQLKELHQINASLNQENDSSEESEGSEIEKKVDDVKSLKRKSITLNLSSSKFPNHGNCLKDCTIDNMKSPSVSKAINEEVKKNMSASFVKNSDSSNESEDSDIEKNDNVESPNCKSKIINLSASQSPKLRKSFKDSTIANIKSPSVSMDINEEIQKNKSVSPQKVDKSSSDDDEESEIEIAIDNAESPKQKSTTLNLTSSKSPKIGNGSKNSTVNIKSPSPLKMVSGKVQKYKSDTSLNLSSNKSLNNPSVIISCNESTKSCDTLDNDARNSLNKSAKQNDSINKDCDSELNCSIKSSQDKSKRFSKSFNSSKVNTSDKAVIEATKTAVIGMSTESLVITNESASKNHSSSAHKKIQQSPEITNLASLFKSLPKSSLTLFSDAENITKDENHIALATTDFKVESSNGANKRKRKDRNETLWSTWSNTAGKFAVIKKMKNQYPTRPISASDSGCTTSFSVITLAKHPKQVLKVDNNPALKFSNFKDEMLYGKRVKREQSSKLFKLQQKIVSKKEKFFSQ